MKLSRPLETSVDAPCGRTDNDEGGRTAPNVRHVKQRRKTPLGSCGRYFTPCATLYSAWAEDRALLGSNPSADPGPEAGGEFVLDGSPPFFLFVALSFILLLWAVMR